MKIIYFVLILLVLEGCYSDKKIGDDMFLDLNAVSNTITYDAGKIVYANWDTSICVYNVERKIIEFKEKIADICYAKPILKNGKIYFPFSNKKFVSKEFNGGGLLWEIGLEGRCSNFDFIDDTTIVASVKHYGLVILNAEQGNLISELKYNYEAAHLPDVSPWLISFDSLNFYVSNWQGNTLSSFRKDGSLNWDFRYKSSCYAGQSFVKEDRLFVGVNEDYKGGAIIILNKLNGEIDFQQACNYEERTAPIFFNGIVYFYSYDRCLNKFDLNNFDLSKVKVFGNDSDIGGHQMFLGLDKIYYTDNSFFLNSYSISKNEFSRIQSIDKNIIGVFCFQGKNYFIN